ncbi:MAG: hypothetical protein MJZ87_09705, partial [Bacteroidales bacterium]|nr:hypothetical protein [Bacteroidales bacterium]
MTKKITVLMLLLLSLTAVGFGQTITQTNTQFPNPGFEKWTNHNCATAQGTSEVPDNWHTFDEVKYDAANILGSENIAKKTSHFKLTGTSAYNNSGASIQLALHEAAGIAWANGTMTSGRTRVGSLTVTSYKNYNYSDLSNASSFGNQHFYWPFVGCPDSMSFYYKTNWTSTSNKPLIKTYLHKNAWYDHANDALNNSGTNSNTNLNVDNYVAGCTKEFATSTSWKRFADKFEYGSFHSNNTDNNYSTLDRPQYILASFSTNKSAGGHQTEDDRLSLDELWCIYDKGLNTLTINGTTPSSLLNAFNAAEFATHEPSRTYDANGNPSFNNSGTSAQDYTTAITLTTPTIATITATPKSKLITNFVVTNPSIFYTTSYPQGTVVVTHNDNSTFTYKINFSNVKLAQPTASNVSRCGAGTVNLTAAVPSGLANPTVPSGFSNYTATCKWYTSASGGTAVSTGTNYSPSVSSTTTYYVSTYITYSYTSAGRTYTRTLESDRKAVTVTVSSAPTVSLSSNKTQSVCSGQAINNITVTSSNGTLSVTGLPTGINLSGSTISGSSNNVGAYPFTVTCASAGCPSATATGTITVKALPTVTISGNTEFCQGGNTTLTASGTGTSYAWSNGTNVAANTVSAAGNYTVTATLNGCTATASQQVTVNALPTINITGNTAFCQGGNTTLTASGASTYVWSNGLGSNATTSAITAGGTYTVTGTDANGCTNTAQKAVTVNALPTINITGNTAFCQGGNTTLTASGA